MTRDTQITRRPCLVFYDTVFFCPVFPGISHHCNDALVNYIDPRKRMPWPAISPATAKWPGSADARGIRQAHTNHKCPQFPVCMSRDKEKSLNAFWDQQFWSSQKNQLFW